MSRLVGKKPFFVFLLALGIRSVFWTFVVNHPERSFTPDSGGYIRLAEALLGSHAYPDIFRTPGYPSFIALVYSLFGKFPQAVLVFQYLLDSSTAVIVALLFFRIFQDPEYSVIAGVLYALNPFAVFYSNMILTETLFTFVLVLSIYFFVISLQTGTKTSLAMASLLLGAAMFCRPAAVYVPFLLAPCLLLGKRGLRNNLTRSLVFLMISYAVVTPWYVRNYHSFGRWTLSTFDEVQYVDALAPEALMVRNNFFAMAKFDMNSEIDRFRKVLLRDAKEKYGWNGDDQQEIRWGSGQFALLLAQAKRVVYDNIPLLFASHLFNISRTLCPYYPPFGEFTGLGSNVIAPVCFGVDILIMMFFAIGIVISLKGSDTRAGRTALIAMMILIFYFSFVPGIVGYARFRIPILPYVSIFSSFGLWRAADRGRSGR